MEETYCTTHLIHKWRNARKSLGRVHESEVKGASDSNERKQSMEMQVVSLVFLEISCQLGSDSCLLMTTIEIPGFTTADMVIWFRSQRKKMRKCYRKTASIFSVSSLLSRVQFYSRYFSFFLIKDLGS